MESQQLKQETISRGDTRDIVLRALRAFGTKYRGSQFVASERDGYIAIGDKDRGRYSCFQDINVFDCSECNAYNNGGDIINVSSANEDGSFTARCTIHGCDDVASEEAESLRSLFDALDSIGFHLTDPPAPHITVEQVRAWMKKRSVSYEWAHADLIDASAQDAALHPTGKCRCAGEGTCEWCGGNEKRQNEQDEYDEKESYNDRCR